MTINCDGVSRELTLPFAACGDPDTLIRLGEEMISQARNLGGFGWIRVDISHPAGGSGGTPLKWRDGA